jgi:hypothetical protein
MNSPALPGLASVAKNHPFFAPWSKTIQSIPNNRAEKTKDVRPNEMPVADQRSEHETNLIGLATVLP